MFNSKRGSKAVVMGKNGRRTAKSAKVAKAALGKNQAWYVKIKETVIKGIKSCKQRIVDRYKGGTKKPSKTSTKKRVPSKKKKTAKKTKKVRGKPSPSKSFGKLPNDAKVLFAKYQKNGWKGNVGGQTRGTAANAVWRNRKNQLPRYQNIKGSKKKKITYKEYDVDNKLPGKNRSARRFVRGSDGKIYYTNNHYKTLIRIK